MKEIYNSDEDNVIAHYIFKNLEMNAGVAKLLKGNFNIHNLSVNNSDLGGVSQILGE